MRTYSHLLVLARDTRAFVDQVDVVGEQSVSTVLRNNTERDQNSQPPSVAARLKEVEVAGVFGRVDFHPNRLFHLLVFELHSRVVAVATRVVVCKHVESLLVALLGDKPLQYN